MRGKQTEVQDIKDPMNEFSVSWHIQASRKQSRFYAALITGILLLLIFLIMIKSKLPQKDLVAEHYDQIDWMQFRPKPVAKIKSNQAPKGSQQEQITNNKPTVERIQLEDMFEQIDLGNLQLETRTPQAPGKAPKAQADLNALQPADLSDLSNDFNLSLDDESPLLNQSSRRRGNGKSNAGIALSLGASSGDFLGEGLGSLGEGVGADLTGPEARGKGGGRVQIGLKSLGDFGDSYDDFSPIYKPLIEWMKKHPAELPAVVKRFMDYRKGDLTSIVYFNVGEREFEMFLLCVESTYEVRIALLEKSQVTYLIDQGFRKRNNLLRVGKADRMPDQSILKFGTKLSPAGDQRAKNFYQIFLSWWESVKHEVEA